MGDAQWPPMSQSSTHSPSTNMSATIDPIPLGEANQNTLSSPAPETPSSSSGDIPVEVDQRLHIPAVSVPLNSISATKPVSTTFPATAASSASSVSPPSEKAPVQPTNAKVPAKKRVVRTNGGDLWRKAIEKATAPPRPYPKLKIPFNLSTPEILAGICEYVDGKDILNLFLTGDRALQHRLTLSIDSWSFHRPMPNRYARPTQNAWPSLVHKIGTIKHLDLVYTKVGRRDQMEPLCYPTADLTKFPLTLRTLKLECRIPSNDYSQLKQFTNLDSLTMGPPTKKHPSQPITPIPFANLPPNLTFLRSTIPLSLSEQELANAEIITPEMRAIAPCFEYLRNVDLPTTETLPGSFIRMLHEDTEVVRLPMVKTIRSELLLELPQNLKELWINFEAHDVNDYLAALPESLKIFKLFGARIFDNNGFRTIPRTVTDLRVPCGTLQLELFAGQWPLPNLLALDIRGKNTGVVINDLPRALLSLRLEGSYGQDLLALPPKLTRLVLPDVRATDAFLQMVSRELVTLKIPSSADCTSSCCWYIPPKLTRLEMGGCMSDRFFQLLPRTLTHLSLLNTASMTATSFKDLPDCLRVLHLPLATIPEPSVVPHLPSSLNVLACHVSSWGPTENSLPPLKKAYEAQVAQEKARKSRILDLVDGRV